MNASNTRQPANWHPTDTGQIKLASHLMQYVSIKFGWPLLAEGAEILHGKQSACQVRHFTDCLRNIPL